MPRGLRDNDIRECYIDSMMIMAYADGEVVQDEINLFVKVVQALPLFNGMNQDQVQFLMKHSLETVIREGIPTRVRDMARRLPDPTLLLKAYELAVMIAFSDGTAAQPELVTLRMMEQEWRLNPNQVGPLIQAAAAAVNKK